MVLTGQDSYSVDVPANTKPGGAETTFRLSAAYPLTKGSFDGWVVTRHVDGTPETDAPVVLRT